MPFSMIYIANKVTKIMNFDDLRNEFSEKQGIKLL